MTLFAVVRLVRVYLRAVVPTRLDQIGGGCRRYRSAPHRTDRLWNLRSFHSRAPRHHFDVHLVRLSECQPVHKNLIKFHPGLTTLCSKWDWSRSKKHKQIYQFLCVLSMYFVYLSSLLSCTGMPTSIFLYDDTCAFCVHWALYWKQLVTDVTFVSLADASTTLKHRIGQNFGTSVHYLTDTSLRSGAHAVFSLLSHAPRRTYWLWIYKHSSIFSRSAEWAYAQISSCRDCGGSLTNLLWRHPQPVLFSIDLLFPRTTLLPHLLRIGTSILLLWLATFLLPATTIPTQLSVVLLPCASFFLFAPPRLRTLSLFLLLITSILLFSQYSTISLFLLLVVLAFSNLSPFFYRSRNIDM